jgi:hypothetical protein
MERLLGGFETAAALCGETQALNVVFVLRLAGGVELARLEQALTSLQRRHPLLGVRVVRDDGRYRFVNGAPAPRVVAHERQSAVTWRPVAEQELNRPLDLGLGPPIRCVYLPPAAAGDGSEIVLTAHHAVLDGASSAPLLTELVALCDAPSSVAAAAITLPPAAETLFPSRFRGPRSQPGRLVFVLRQLAAEVSYRLRRPGPSRPPGEGPVECRILPLALSEGLTTQLVRRSRRERATLTGALTAALLLAVQRCLQSGRAGLRHYFSFADLRPYLLPVPTAETVAAYVSPLRLTIPLPENADFWPLARGITRQIGAAGRRGDKFHAARLMAATMRVFLRRRSARMATVALSYTGAVRFAGESGALRVRGLHAFVSNLSIGPEFTASVKLVGERLVWDIVYLEADMDAILAKSVAGEIVRLLARAARIGGARE